MSYEVDKLMSEYSSLSPKDTKEFDRRYKEHQQFRRALNGLVKEFVKAKKAKDVKPTEQGSTLLPVVAILTTFTVALVLVAQSGLLRAVLARLAEVQ